MKQLLLSLGIMLLTLSVHAQKDETVFGNSGVRFTGLWGGATNNINGFQDDFDFYSGGHFGFELKRMFVG